ncbi:MAG TPA: hypothetical protein VK208_19400 [Pyrinomonadaceae bacterium]|jgi:hypothetical protein|nr:hypothetical protein [Pyrinomonadaceae bacterium]
MKGQIVPDSDHVARYCKASTVEGSQIQATAFMLRDREEYLSVNWLEDLNRSDRKSEISALQEIYSRKLSIGTAAQIAVLNVGTLRTKVASETHDTRWLRVLHDPILPEDPSHSGIYNFSSDDEIIAELIAQTVLERYPAKR